MPNPYRKHTRHRRDSRRSANWRLELGGVSRCSNCGTACQPHTVCGQCGFYGGKLVVAKKDKKKKGKQDEGGQKDG